MPKSRIVRTSEEIYSYLDKYFKSGIKSPKRFAINNNLPPTTFYQWLMKYNASLVSKEQKLDENQIVNTAIVRTSPPGFYDITTEATESVIKEPNEVKPINNIKLLINNYTLEFDVSNLKLILEALK